MWLVMMVAYDVCGDDGGVEMMVLMLILACGGDSGDGK